MVGGQFGDGALRKAGKTVGYYNPVSASYGLQFGAQVSAYVLLLMTDTALIYLDRSEGFEVGVGPSVVVADPGVRQGPHNDHGPARHLCVQLRPGGRHGGARSPGFEDHEDQPVRIALGGTAGARQVAIESWSLWGKGETDESTSPRTADWRQTPSALGRPARGPVPSGDS